MFCRESSLHTWQQLQSHLFCFGTQCGATYKEIKELQPTPPMEHQSRDPKLHVQPQAPAFWDSDTLEGGPKENVRPLAHLHLHYGISERGPRQICYSGH
ncbi:hypothetical protein ScPMuIL_014621 [Solemya velum]